MSQKTSLNQPTLIKRGSEGFTLVELLVVIAIIAILAGLISLGAHLGAIEWAEDMGAKD